MEGLCMLVLEDITPEMIAAVFSRLLPGGEIHPLDWEKDFGENGRLASERGE